MNIYGTKEMAERLGLAQSTVRQYAREGRIQPMTTLKTGSIERYIFYDHSIILRALERPRRKFEKANQSLTQPMMYIS